MALDPQLRQLLEAARSGDPLAKDERREGKIPVHVEWIADLPPLPALASAHRARIGNHLSVEASLAQVEELTHMPGVRVTAARRLGAEAAPAKPARATSRFPLPPWLPSDDGHNGDFGLIDVGLNVQHPTFRHPATGRSRILGVWDLRSNPPTPVLCCPEDLRPEDFAPLFGGTYYGPADLARFMREQRAPLDLLDVDGPDPGHGTAVANLAVGLPWGRTPETTPQGHASGASIYAVLVPEPAYTTDVHLALSFLAAVQRTSDKPLVCNMSLGEQTGAHDGTNELEQIIDTWSDARAGRVFVKSAGNERNDELHAEWTALEARPNPLDIYLIPQVGAWTRVLELWGEVGAPLPTQVTIRDRTGALLLTLTQALPNARFQEATGRYSVQADLLRDEPSARPHVYIAFRGDVPTANAAPWGNVDISVDAPQRWRAWAQKHPGGLTVTGSSVCERHTISCPGSARRVVCVANLDPTQRDGAASRSSRGPTTDEGRPMQAPHLALAGENLQVADAATQGTVTRSGTSLAAPQAAGAILSVLSALHAKGRQPTATQILQAIPLAVMPLWNEHVGFGQGQGPEQLLRVLT